MLYLTFTVQKKFNKIKIISALQQNDSVIHIYILFHILFRYGSSQVIEYTAAAAAKSLQSCLTLCDPIDASPPGSPIPGILQARTLEWVAISFSNA